MRTLITPKRRLREVSACCKVGIIEFATLVGVVLVVTIGPPFPLLASAGEPMVLVPGGRFQMGSTREQVEAARGFAPTRAADRDPTLFDDERPIHPVVLDSYRIDRYEVTIADYQRCVIAGQCARPQTLDTHCWWREPGSAIPVVPDYPINCITWDQARAFCESVGKRLPTEAEWERAARGPDRSTYPWGDLPPSCELTLMAMNSQLGCGFANLLPIGSKPRDESPDGVSDMGGSLSEWTSDYYSAGYYAISPEQNPRGPQNGADRVVRGGSWQLLDATDFRGARRVRSSPDTASSAIGFRCVKTLIPRSTLNNR